MKRWNKILGFFLVLIVVIQIAVPTNGVEAAQVKLSTSSVTISVGQTYALKVTGTTKKVTWTSSNNKIALVSNGKIKGIKTGSATITATVDKKKYTAKVTVVNNISSDDFSFEEYVPDVNAYAMVYTEFINEKKNQDGIFHSFDSSDGSKEGIKKTARGIIIGSKSSEVLKAYGNESAIKYSSKDYIHQYVEKNYPEFDTSRWVKYLEYKYTEKSGDSKGEYRIRFYLDKDSKVTEIMFIKNYNGFKK